MGRRTKPRLVEENLGYGERKGEKAWARDREGETVLTGRRRVDQAVRRIGIQSFLFLRQAAPIVRKSSVKLSGLSPRARRRSYRSIYTLERGIGDSRCLRKMNSCSSTIAGVRDADRTLAYGSTGTVRYVSSGHAGVAIVGSAAILPRVERKSCVDLGIIRPEE